MVPTNEVSHVQEHTDDLRNVAEGDHVELTTTNGLTVQAECTNRETQQADPRSGEVRETNIWEFVSDDYHIAASILDGLRSSENDPEFPQYNELWEMNEQENMGYISEVEIHGKMEA